MEHLSFDIICRIVDEDIPQDEITLYLTHLNSCTICRQEVEFQKSIMRASRRANLSNPSSSFTKNILDVIMPSGKKKWYERLLQNMGNVFAMTSVLAFLGYVYSVIGTGNYQLEKLPNTGSISNFTKIIQEYSHLLIGHLSLKFTNKDTGLADTNTIVFALLAIIILIFIDQIARRFLHHSKI